MAYYFKKISLAEQNYNISDKELLVIVAALKKWYIYIKGVVDIMIYIDYKNFLLFTTIKKFNK